MLLLIIFGIFLALVLASVPLAFAVLATTAASMVALSRDYPFEAIYLTFIGGIEPFHLTAVPLFIIAGELLGRGGVGKRIIEFARAAVGFLPGGMGIVTVSSSMIFAGVSGAAVADTAAVGSVMVPAMHQRGYDKAFAAALVASAGTIGIIIPPSIPMLIYAFVGNVSVAELFLAGFIPGLIIGLGLIAVCVVTGKRSGCDSGGQRTSLPEVWAAFLRCAPAIAMPLIILGGIFSGIVTPTESAALAACYGLLIAIYVYRDLRWADVPAIVLHAFVISATILISIGATSALAWFITLEQVPALLTEMISEISSSKIAFLLLVNLVLLALGMFLELVPALILTAPLFIPTAQAFGVDPVHLGLIMVCNLAIGLYSPPVGATLFVASQISGVGVGPIVRRLMPIFAISLATLAIITYVPVVSMGLVWLSR